MRQHTALLLFALFPIHEAVSFVLVSNHHFSYQPQPLQFTSPDAATNNQKENLPPEFIDEIDALVAKRADARRCGNYDLADAMRSEIDRTRGGSIVPPGYRIELTDIPRKLGGGSTWEIVPEFKEPIERRAGQDGDKESSVLQLSHAAIGLAAISAEKDLPLNTNELDDIVSKALARLERTGPTELRGRKAADAAFWFALAGISDDISPNASELFDSLTLIAIEELLRFGYKPSCRAKDIMHIVERLYAAGINGKLAHRLSLVAASCLEAKDFKGRNTSTSMDIIDLLRTNSFDMHSDRTLLWIWRFSIRQRKQRSFLRGAAEQYKRFGASSRIDGAETLSPTSIVTNQGETHTNDGYKWEDLFDDPSLPLVVDIGCGFGVSLHGLATIGEVSKKEEIDLEWDKCNFVGVDLSRLAVGFAKGIANRWGVSGRLRYVLNSAEDFLQQATKSYPGNIRLILIQFPTPYRLQPVNFTGRDQGVDNPLQENGNLQLPKHPYSGFMVTENLLGIAREALRPCSGRLLLQSNCEDVCVFMRRLAAEVGFSVVPISNHITSFDDSKTRIPKRTFEYMQMGGERALGVGWALEALLPRRAATETEVACFLETTPVHRSLLVPGKDKGEEDGPSA